MASRWKDRIDFDAIAELIQLERSKGRAVASWGHATIIALMDEAKETERLREMNATQVELVQKARDEERKARQTITHERAKRRADVRLMEIERDRAREHADLLMRRLDELYAEQPRWIPVEERLPEAFLVEDPGYQTSDNCWVWVDDGENVPYGTEAIYVEDACDEGGPFWMHLGTAHQWYEGEGVTHWMPLPEPPKVER